MTNKSWTIDSIASGGKDIVKVKVDRFPFTIGRNQDASLVINSPDISRQHSEISFSGTELYLCDLESTNGTYVNYRQIKDKVQLSHGDIIHFGSNEYRIMSSQTSPENLSESDQTIFRNTTSLSKKLPVGLPLLENLLEGELVTSVFQTIHDSHSKIYGVEALGRGTMSNLSNSPVDLLNLAESGNLEIKLSDLFRKIGAEIAFSQAPQKTLFVNTHPNELRDLDSLIKSLSELPHYKHSGSLVLEIHENSISDVGKLRELVTRLREMKIGLAYDDFGAGQSRLRELLEVPPDYLKFDIWLIKNIHSAPTVKKKMLQSLIDIAKDSETEALAEGVETRSEFECCADMGITLFQGYYFSKPKAEISL